MTENSTTDAEQAGDDRGISVGRDANGNAFVTGDNNSVKVILYQTVSQQRQPEEPHSTDIGPNPYMGLLAFHEEDADRFFGREKQITRLWEKLIKNWSQAGLSGYRLPLEAEWEYACRAGTRTRWSCGESEELLSRYAQYGRMGNPLAAGSLKPNDWGLFDMHGNVSEWCQDAYQEQLAVDIASELSIDKTFVPVLRGGWFSPNAQHVRSAERSTYIPVNRSYIGNGFRVAKTYP